MSLKGRCNQCGLCCFVDGGKCTNLIVHGEPGQPMATECMIYNDRYPGRPIILMRPDGSYAEGHCWHNAPNEEAILTKLIEQGKCSLEVDNGSV